MAVITLPDQPRVAGEVQRIPSPPRSPVFHPRPDGVKRVESTAAEACSMAPSNKHLLVAAGVATIAVGAAWYLSSRRRSASKAAASPKAAKAPPCCATTPAEKPEAAAAAAPQLTEEEQQRAAAMQEAVRAKERGNKRFQGRQYQLVRAAP